MADSSVAASCRRRSAPSPPRSRSATQISRYSPAPITSTLPLEARRTRAAARESGSGSACPARACRAARRTPRRRSRPAACSADSAVYSDACCVEGAPRVDPQARVRGTLAEHDPLAEGVAIARGERHSPPSRPSHSRRFRGNAQGSRVLPGAHRVHPEPGFPTNSHRSTIESAHVKRLHELFPTISPHSRHTRAARDRRSR